MRDLIIDMVRTKEMVLGETDDCIFLYEDDMNEIRKDIEIQIDFRKLFEKQYVGMCDKNTFILQSEDRKVYCTRELDTHERDGKTGINTFNFRWNIDNKISNQKQTDLINYFIDNIAINVETNKGMTDAEMNIGAEQMRQAAVIAAYDNTIKTQEKLKHLEEHTNNEKQIKALNKYIGVLTLQIEQMNNLSEDFHL